MAKRSSTIEDLRKAIRTHPLIDNHAHNLLQPDELSVHPFESITTEAGGQALKDTINTLSHIRAVKQLSELFDCEEDWAEIIKAREKHVHRDYEGLVKKCFQGTASILMDDGLDGDGVYPYKWHDKFCRPGGTKRIVRIEAVAQDILHDLIPETAKNIDTSEVFPEFMTKFEEYLVNALEDDVVVGFKSVICYRSGLDVEPEVNEELVKSELLEYFVFQIQEKRNYRIDVKALNDYLVVTTLNVLTHFRATHGVSKPIQFHTGLGDNDISLLTANPAHMQSLIEAFPEVEIVLLHSAYPYTREAGYLASVFKNVYLDIGEVFPMLSRDGQESVLKQSLELTPGNKILWSTDGHWHPETYWLANKQFRAALEEVLTIGVQKGDYSTSQAIDLTTKILFENSNSLYNLSLSPYPMANGDRTGIRGHVSKKDSEVTLVSPSSLSNFNSISQLDAFLALNPDIQYVWLHFVDYTATNRVKMVPLAEFKRQVRSQSRPGITTGLFYLLQNDHLASGGSATGSFFLEADLSSLCLNVGLSSKSASVMNFWREKNGEHIEGCPRTTLAKIMEEAKRDFGMAFLIGFEIEIIFVRPMRNEETGEINSFEPWHSNHAWATLSFENRAALPMIEEIVGTLATIGIHLPQFHCEAAPGQWEFILPPYPPLQAVDNLIRTKQVIAYVGEKYGLRATMYPRPYPWTCGSANHAHFSMSPLSHESAFLAGVLEHLPAMLAFTMPTEASYERLMSGIWSGGEWVAWGTQNKEVPLRKVEDGHYELKTVDGLANMYFAMAALLGSGLLGVMENMKLTIKDCSDNVSNLDAKGREEFGITKRLPKTLDESLFALMHDLELKDMLGHDFVRRYNMVKKAEKAALREMSPEKRRIWLMERY